MYKTKKVVIVIPAYNAAQTLRRTHGEIIAEEVVDQIIVVDDGSSDDTAAVARSLEGVFLHMHPRNQGYGASQKTCYRLALEQNADIVVIVHADYQYTPRLIPAMVALVASGPYSCVLASRILGGGALKGGMPLWRYASNRVLTFVENLLTGAKLSEYHTGYRAFSADLLRRLPLETNSDDFVFDNQILLQTLWLDYLIAEVTCPTRYFAEASSMNFRRCCVYGLSCLWNALRFRLAKMGLRAGSMFERLDGIPPERARAEAK